MCTYHRVFLFVWELVRGIINPHSELLWDNYQTEPENHHQIGSVLISTRSPRHLPVGDPGDLWVMNGLGVNPGSPFPGTLVFRLCILSPSSTPGGSLFLRLPFLTAHHDQAPCPLLLCAHFDLQQHMELFLNHFLCHDRVTRLFQQIVPLVKICQQYVEKNTDKITPSWLCGLLSLFSFIFLKKYQCRMLFYFPKTKFKHQTNWFNIRHLANIGS